MTEHPGILFVFVDFIVVRNVSERLGTFFN